MKTVRRALFCGALVLASFAAPARSQAQTAEITGIMSGFDVLNDTGQPAHGFEMQLQGAAVSDVTYILSAYTRYGTAVVTAYATGVYVRWQSAYINGQYTATTLPAPYVSFAWQDCYNAGAGYKNSGCEHLGLALRVTSSAVTVTARWLVDDPNNPGQLIPSDPPVVSVPLAVWSVTPLTSGAPVVVAIAATPLPAPPALFGDAQWIKVFKTELPRSVTADELVSGNTAVLNRNF